MQGLAEPSPDELRIPETIEPRLQPPPETHREVAQLLERCQVDLQKAVVGIPAAHVASSARRRGCRSGVKSALTGWRAGVPTGSNVVRIVNWRTRHDSNV